MRGILVLTTFMVACVDIEGLEDLELGEDLEEESGAADGAIEFRALEFFSQLDPMWAGDQLGTCNLTIGSHGCAVTAAAMLLSSAGVDITPKTLNDYLKHHDGYVDGCLIDWAKAAKFDGPDGVEWVHHGTLGSPEALRAGLDQGKRVIAKSTRFTQHFVYIVGYDEPGLSWTDFYYWDPADLSVKTRRIDDGWVEEGAVTRVFR